MPHAMLSDVSRCSSESITGCMREPTAHHNERAQEDSVATVAAEAAQVRALWSAIGVEWDPQGAPGFGVEGHVQGSDEDSQPGLHRRRHRQEALFSRKRNSWGLIKN